MSDFMAYGMASINIKFPKLRNKKSSKDAIKKSKAKRRMSKHSRKRNR